MVPFGDDIEPVGESRADVEMGNEEERRGTIGSIFSRIRMNPKNPTSRNKCMKIQDMLSAGVGVLLVSKVEVLVDNIELNC